MERAAQRSCTKSVPLLLQTYLYDPTEYGFTTDTVILKSVYPKILETISSVKILYALLWR